MTLFCGMSVGERGRKINHSIFEGRRRGDVSPSIRASILLLLSSFLLPAQGTLGGRASSFRVPPSPSPPLSENSFLSSFPRKRRLNSPFRSIPRSGSSSGEGFPQTQPSHAKAPLPPSSPCFLLMAIPQTVFPPGGLSRGRKEGTHLLLLHSLYGK